MKTTKGTILHLSFCAGIITICLILIVQLSGFRHEFKKFKQFILTLTAILLIRYIFLDHIVFLIQALVLTLWERKQVHVSQAQEVAEDKDETAGSEHKPVDFLKLHLESLKSKLNLNQSQKDETLNWEYKQLTEEFWRFGKYFFSLLLVVVYSRNQFSYYNTAITRRILNDSYYSNYNLENLVTITQLYSWINDTFTGAINEGREYDGSRINEPGWVQFHQAKLLGVVRLQQVRHAKKENNMVSVYFDDQDYLPGWQKLNKSLSYADKYWRIYYPWLSRRYEGAGDWLVTFLNTGLLYTYSNNKAYAAVLTRDLKNSEKVLNFLKEYNWLDAMTAAVFIDFTLYNADSNIFTVCSILVEQTPIGGLVCQINVQSAELLWNINELSMWWWMLIVLYTFQMLEFCKEIILRIWFVSGFFNLRWNYVDVVIVLCNIMLVSLTLLREYYVLHVMKTFVLAQKLQFVDFRIACILNYMANVTLGFLVCIASIRLWKILQFSSIFRIFNRTLYTSGVPVIITMLGIYVIICAICKAAQLLNGSHSAIFSSYFKSFTSILSFAFGFTSATSATDLTQGSRFWGILLYLILMLVVATFLINMFITLICIHFSNAREERDQEPPDKLTYWQFIMEEYPFVKNFFKRISPFYYKTKNQTVRENINDRLDDLDKKIQDQQLIENSTQQTATEEDQMFDEEKKRADRIQNVAAILNLQMEILDRLIMVQSIEWDSENDDDLD